MTDVEKRLSELRAQLAEAEAAIDRATKERKASAKRAALAVKADVEKALTEIHLKAEEMQLAKMETRPAEAAPETRAMTLMEMNQSASTQSVKDTAALSEIEHAHRRNPKHT